MKYRIEHASFFVVNQSRSSITDSFPIEVAEEHRLVTGAPAKIIFLGTPLITLQKACNSL